jgi:two-component system invasion response regulator UvrY
MIHVLIVENHDLVRAGLRRLLEECPDIHTISEASNGEAALRFCREESPDVVLLDLNPPGLSAFEITGRIRRIGGKARVIILAPHAKSPYPTRLLDAGAMGYLTRDCEAAELIDAIRTVRGDQRYIGTEAAKQLALSMLPGTAESPFDDLSSRELEVMLKLTEGNRVPDIASMMCLSPKTVATYKYRIYDKLGTRNEVDLLRMAMRYGLLEASPAWT